jgi:vacuole morphology and inheritance protein 14
VFSKDNFHLTHFSNRMTTNTIANVVASSRSKIGREDIKWQDLFTHFRNVQAKHEKARRTGMGGNPGPLLDGYSTSNAAAGGGGGGRPPVRRRVTGDAPLASPGMSAVATPTRGSGALSPLNPRARTAASNGLMNALSGGNPGRPMSPNSLLNQQRAKRGLSITRK